MTEAAKIGVVPGIGRQNPLKKPLGGVRLLVLEIDLSQLSQQVQETLC